MAKDPKKKYPRPRTVGYCRGLSDRELVNLFFDEPGSRAIAFRVINERMHDDGHSEFCKWVWTIPPKLMGGKKKTSAGGGKKEVVLKEAKEIETKPGVKLRDELKYISESGCKFEDTDDPERCQRFCSARGNVWDLTEEQLTAPQKRMVGLLRDRYRDYQRSRKAG